MIKPSQTRDPEIHQPSLYFGLLFTIDFLRVFKVLLLRLLHNLIKKTKGFYEKSLTLLLVPLHQEMVEARCYNKASYDFFLT